MARPLDRARRPAILALVEESVLVGIRPRHMRDKESVSKRLSNVLHGLLPSFKLELPVLTSSRGVVCGAPDIRPLRSATVSIFRVLPRRSSRPSFDPRTGLHEPGGLPSGPYPLLPPPEAE